MLPLSISLSLSFFFSLFLFCPLPACRYLFLDKHIVITYFHRIMAISSMILLGFLKFTSVKSSLSCPLRPAWSLSASLFNPSLLNSAVTMTTQIATVHACL